jgi:formylmethanofuran dehydrogenase subunit A
MRDANACKKGIQFLIFPSPIHLHCNDLPIKKMFHMLLKDMKLREHLRFMLQKKDPGKHGVIINEAYIVAMFTDRTWGKPPTHLKT